MIGIAARCPCVHRTDASRQTVDMGHQLPRRLPVRAAAMAPITDTKSDGWGGSSLMRHS
jgi:hypothetical protein